MNAQRLLWQSVDVKRHKNRVLWLVVIWVILTAVQFGLEDFLGERMSAGITFLILIGRLVCEIFVIYDLFKILGIVFRHKRVFFAECTLSEFGCTGGHYFFRVKLPTAEGTYHTCTNAIYSDTSLHADYNDWKDKRVIVAYDREKDVAIVIDKATEELRKQAGLP